MRERGEARAVRRGRGPEPSGEGMGPSRQARAWARAVRRGHEPEPSGEGMSPSRQARAWARAVRRGHGPEPSGEGMSPERSEVLRLPPTADGKPKLSEGRPPGGGACLSGKKPTCFRQPENGQTGALTGGSAPPASKARLRQKSPPPAKLISQIRNIARQCLKILPLAKPI